MSRSKARTIFWIALAAMLPLPFFLVVTGRVPALRLVELGAVNVAILVEEGPRGVVGILAAILLAQGFAYLALLWLVADVVSRVLARLPARFVARVTLVIVLGGALAASLFEVYETPFRRDAPRATLVHVYE